ncbi:MAG: hypothetical protein JW731_00090 [Bacteroidales bacterium]|nr:hypothetical protein [Bacteroidales bacterium]
MKINIIVAEPRSIYKEWFIALIAASSGEYNPEIPIHCVIGISSTLFFQFTIVSEITVSLI